MPRVRVRYFAGVAELLGTRGEELAVEDGTTLEELLLKHIPAEHPNAGRGFIEALFKVGEAGVESDEDGSPVLSGRYLVVVNGRSHSSLPGGLRYELMEGDVVSVFPPLGGG